MEMTGYEFFDGHFILGDPYMSSGLSPEGAISILDAAGIKNAVIRTREQEYRAPDTAVENLNAVLARHERLFGLYPMLPDCTGDLPPLSEALAAPEFARYAGFLLSPEAYRLPAHPAYLREYFEAACARRIPVWYNLAGDGGYVYLAGVLEAWPELIAVLSFDDEWPNARRLYPLFQRFRNTCLLTSNMIWMGAYEDFCARFGPERLIFSTRAPEKYPGAAILDLRAADIPESAKKMIAGGNLRRLIGGICRG